MPPVHGDSSGAGLTMTPLTCRGGAGSHELRSADMPDGPAANGSFLPRLTPVPPVRALTNDCSRIQVSAGAPGTACSTWIHRPPVRTNRSSHSELHPMTK